MLIAASSVAILVGVTGLVYGRWAGWSFGLRWWGRPTPAVVRKVEGLKGAVMKGGAPWAMRESRHRVRAHLDVHPPTRASYVTTTITWVDAGDSLVGRDVIVRASRTRGARIWLPRDPAAAGRSDLGPPDSGTY